MFATKTDTRRKSPAAGERDPSGVATRAAQSNEVNPLWQSLALRPLAIQTKLAISQPDDPYEREADSIADRVMRMATPPGINDKLQFTSSTSLKAQRKCDHCKDEEEKTLQRKEQTGNADASVTAPSIVHEALDSPGQPLARVTRDFLEPRYGADFGNVRIHTGGPAERAAEAVHARAFTVGSDVVLGRGEYNPGTAGGDRLLAHELAHTLQQQNRGNNVRDQLQRTTYSDCTDRQQLEMISPAQTQALADLQSVINSLAANPLSDLTTASLFLAFRSQDQNTADTVRSRLIEIRDGLNSGTMECEQPDGWQFMCERGRLGYTLLFGTIHLCMNSWPGVSQTLRAGNLIHEGAHAFAWLVGDPGYFDYQTCAETAATSSLTTGSRLATSDAYSCFVYYMLHDTGIPARAESYRGANLVMTQTPAGSVNLNAADVRSPMFSITGAPSHSGFRFRWIVADSQNRSYLMRADSGNPFEFGNHPIAYIGAATRALLKDRGISQVEVRCRVQFIGGGDRLFTLAIQLTK
jgi:hypothetical protein